jgi:hypothetical protein
MIRTYVDQTAQQHNRSLSLSLSLPVFEPDRRWLSRSCVTGQKEQGKLEALSIHGQIRRKTHRWRRTRSLGRRQEERRSVVQAVWTAHPSFPAERQNKRNAMKTVSAKRVGRRRRRVQTRTTRLTLPPLQARDNSLHQPPTQPASLCRSRASLRFFVFLPGS